jgi:hypothetical protein
MPERGTGSEKEGVLDWRIVKEREARMRREVGGEPPAEPEPAEPASKKKKAEKKED